MENKQPIPRTGISQPLVSVVVAAYNSAPYIQETIESILAQTYTNYELIIVDDASNDETLRILDRFDDHRIVILRNEKNLGVARARNRGNQIARGEYIAVQDADDISKPERLERQVAFLEAHPDIGLVGTRGYLSTEGGEQPLNVPLHNENIQKLLLGQNCLHHSSLMIRSSLMKQVGGYNEKYRYAPDYELVLRLSEITKVANLPERLYLKRGVRNSITYSQRALIQQRLVYQAVEEAIYRRRQKDKTLLPHKKFALTCLAVATAEATFGNVNNIRRYLDRAIKLDDDLTNLVEAAEMISNYTLGYTTRTSDSNKNPKEIVLRIFANWPDHNKANILFRRTMALVLAGDAFLAYRNSQWKNAIYNAINSIMYWPTRSGNRGLLSVIARSGVNMFLNFSSELKSLKLN